MYIKSLLLSFVLLIHLQTSAGELVSISNIQSLKPIIEVQLTTQQASALKQSDINTATQYSALYLITNGKVATTPVACRYEISNTTLIYTPMYPLGYDLDFEVQYTNDKKIVITEQFSTPPNPQSKTVAKVVTAYPISDTIPFNTLFFHIGFSEQMANDKHAYKYIKVFGADGTELKNAWRQKSFWLDNGKLLVLMIHPGRVKNGIHYESPLFDSAQYYTIVVSKDIKDINGNSIAANYSQQYYVKGEDRISPKLNYYKIAQPAANTQNAILLSFSEGMDNASVLDGAKVYDTQGKEVACTIQESYTDQVFKITPINKWKKGTYTLSLKSSIYDFSANRIGRLFELTDVQDIEKDKELLQFQFRVD